MPHHTQRASKKRRPDPSLGPFRSSPSCSFVTVKLDVPLGGLQSAWHTPARPSVLHPSGIWPPAPRTKPLHPLPSCSGTSHCWSRKMPQRPSRAAGSPPAKRCNSSGITPLFSTQLLSTFCLQNSGPGRREALLLSLPDPAQDPTHIPAHGAELLPSTRNIAALVLLTIHLGLN